MNSLIGVLLINLGTPADPSIRSVRRYLQQFLSDPRVIELPFLLRWLLLKIIILPWRAKRSARAYASIWQADGSPLLINSLKMQAELQATLGEHYLVVLGMRYGEPSVTAAISKLNAAKLKKLIVLPLFPQYASAANGSALEHTLKILAKRKEILATTIISDFHQEPAYIQACAAVIQPFVSGEHDYVLMSYHGLPERQLINPGISCYRTKCLQTAELIAKSLALAPDKWSVSFQSRLGRLPWIKPYTDQMLQELRQRGYKKLIVVCPSFVADCLETLEEIGLRAKEQWLQLGGEELVLVPSLNAHPAWISAMQTIVTKNCFSH